MPNTSKNTNTNTRVLPVFDVHAPEVIVKQVEEVRLAKHVLVRHNRRDVIVDKVSVDGVVVDDDGDDGDEGAMDDVLHADDALHKGLQLSRLLCALCGWRCWYVVVVVVVVGGTSTSLFPSSPEYDCI